MSRLARKQQGYGANGRRRSEVHMQQGSVFALSVCPLSVFEANRAALVEAEERARRVRLIEQADHTCQKCGLVAWSVQRMREMQLRPKDAVAGTPSTGDWVVCLKCAQAYDEKHSARQRHKKRRAG